MNPRPLIEAMMRPDFYPHAVDRVEMVQTHISWVFLTGPFAYKVKKPVDFGFVDFTTLERRRFFCEQELILNRRLAPELYLEVLPIGRNGGAYRLGGKAGIEEYCLKMVQFSQDDLLDRRLEHANFDPAWMDQLAADVSTFHATAETGPAIQAFGAPHFLRDHIEANFSVAREHLGEVISDQRLSSLRELTGTFLRHHSRRLEKRQREGRIRACHGDLHLKNIALYHEKPKVFDCIEFNDEFRMIDTMNDVAFLIMDCDARNRPDLGLRFLSRYLEYSGDYGGLMLLPLYLSYRAGVRGKVACLLSKDEGIAPEARAQQLAEAARYFSLAESYMLPKHPRLFAVGGLSGSGKSRLALLGCGAERAVVIRSDATRKRLAGRLSDLPLYGREMNARTYASMLKAAKLALAAGFSVILDATFQRREDRDRVRRLGESAGTGSRLFWLDVDEATLRQHIRRRVRKGTDVSDADLRVLEMQLEHYQRPDEADIRFLSSTEAWPA